MWLERGLANRKSTGSERGAQLPPPVWTLLGTLGRGKGPGCWSPQAEPEPLRRQPAAGPSLHQIFLVPFSL